MYKVRKEELKELLNMMSHTSAQYYQRAVRHHVHEFVEFTGLINEYLKMCQDMVDRDIDPTVHGLKGREHNFRYIAEKLICIFGDALSDPSNLEALLTPIFTKLGYSLETSPAALKRIRPSIPTDVQERLNRRPENYADMTPADQWEVDKGLDLLDYNPADYGATG